ncbi:hypothetical protein S40288_09596 [Stachybotrys chartarum IBT 40288]|nr:hypothetical protein S40288_09596 [Stachybotrys chartarum IBT 40288]
MTTTTSPATREHWLELIAKRKQRQRCADDVEAIKRACSTICASKHVAECKDCYPKVIERIRARYCGSPEQEWFTERKAFLHKLDGLLSDAKEQRAGLKLIDEILESEKEAWYRWVLRTYPEFFAVAPRSIDTKELRTMLDDPDRSLEEVVATVWRGLDQPANWAADVDAFIAKVDAANGDAAALKQLHVSQFFSHEATGEAYEAERQYRQDYLAGPTSSLDSIMDKIIAEYQNGKKAQPQRIEFQNQLDAVRRAKVAHEQKMRDRNNKRNQPPPVNERLYDLPPCYVCRSAVDPKDVFSCTICQAERQMGADRPLTAYCSERCFHRGHVGHSEKAHDCEAGDQCAQLRDQDTAMGDNGSDHPVVCRECLGKYKITLYCNDRCAGENLKQHKQDKHGVNEGLDSLQGHTQALQEVLDTVLAKGNPGLQFKPVDEA